MALASWWNCDFDVDCAYHNPAKTKCNYNYTWHVRLCVCVATSNSKQHQTEAEAPCCVACSCTCMLVLLLSSSSLNMIHIYIKQLCTLHLHHALRTWPLAIAYCLLPALGILESGSEPRTSGCEPSRSRIRTKLDSDPNQAN